MSEPHPDLLPTVTLQHRYGEQRLLANRRDYIREKDGRFRNWLLADDDPELKPAPIHVPEMPAPSAPPGPSHRGRHRRRGRRR